MDGTARSAPLGKLRRVWSDLDAAPDSLAPGLSYARGMHGRPLDYYLARVKQLGLRGATVLDAGCGTGTWSFALRTSFDEVTGLDVSEERIAVARWLAEQAGVGDVAFRVGSLLETGLADESVDTVFCYGVLISAVPVRDALTEFARILKPGGIAYVCLNGLGWSLYLRDERGQAEPAVAEMGRQGLYNTLVQSLPDHELAAIRAYGRGPPPAPDRPAIREQLRVRLLRRLPIVAAAGRSKHAVRLAEAILDCWVGYLAPSGMPNSRLQAITDLVARECGAPYTVQLALDLQALARGERDGFSHATAGRGYTPDEVREICGSVGLIDFQWACEGELAGAVAAEPPAPIHDGYVDGHLKVWEFIAFKPEPGLACRIGPDWFRHNARAAAQLPYLAQARMPLLTNADPSTTPSGWVEEARRRSEAAGGERLIAALAETLCRDAVNDHERVERLVRFAQDALVHHPIVQPFTFNGAAVTDPATSLFLGIGRCGASAHLVTALCQAAGFRARVERVPGHLFTLCEVDGSELILEADVFKKGVMLRGPDGGLPGYEPFLTDPNVADANPVFTAWWTTHLKHSTDIWGRQPYGYVEADGALRLYSSYFRKDDGPRHLPRVPRLQAERSGSALHLSWTDATPVDGAAVAYRVALRRASRDWDYAHEPDDLAAVLAPPAADHELRVEGATEVEIDWPAAAWVEVAPRLEERPEAFCWPSNEARVAAS